MADESSIFDESAPTAFEASGELSDPDSAAVAPSSPITPNIPKSSSLDFRARQSPLEPAVSSFSSSSMHRSGSSAGGSFDAIRKRPLAPAKMRKRSSEPGAANLSRSSTENPIASRIPSPRLSKSPTPGDEDQFAMLPARRRGSTPLSGSSHNSAGSQLADQQQRSPTVAGLPPLNTRSSTPPPNNVRSPHASLDNTSYHPAPISPPPPTTPSRTASPGAISPFSSPEHSTPAHLRDREPSQFSTGSVRSFHGEGGAATLLDFFGHDRPSSIASNSSVDQYQILLRQAAELTRKLKDSEARLDSDARQYEAEHSELETRLDEVRAELAQKRREEKELRSTEKQHLSQIRDLELEVAKLTKSLEGSRGNYESMKKAYQEQLGEADHLRGEVAKTRREQLAAEDNLAAQAGIVAQVEKDNELLQQHVTRLEQDLLEAKKAQDELDEQKRDNLALKETIDRLKFDIDEIQQTSLKAQILAGGKGAEGMSITRSLGRELAAELGEGEGPSSTESEGEEDEDEGDEDVVVTTTRRIKKRGGNLRKSFEPVVIQRETVVVETGTQTDPIPPPPPISTATSNVQTELSVSPAVALVEQPVQVVSVAFETQTFPAPAPPAPPAPIALTPAELKAQLAADLGIDLAQLERFVADPTPPGSLKSIPPSPAGGIKPNADGVYLSRRVGRWASRFSPRAASSAPVALVNSFPAAAQPLVAQLVDTTMHFALYSITVYLSGVLTGSYLLPITHHHHLHPLAGLMPDGGAQRIPYDQLGIALASTTKGAWQADGTTGGTASGLMEGVQWAVNRLIWNGVRVAQRHPV